MYGLLRGTHPCGEEVCRFLSGSSHDCVRHGVVDRASALEWICLRCAATDGTRQTSRTITPSCVLDMLETELLPHVGIEGSVKASVLCDMARRCALVAMGLVAQDDRDSYVNKRVDPSGILLGNLFRQCYSRFAKDARKTLLKDLATRCRQAHKDLANGIVISNIARSSIIENGMRTALATGTWGVKNNAKAGISQVLSRCDCALVPWSDGMSSWLCALL